MLNSPKSANIRSLILCNVVASLACYQATVLDSLHGCCISWSCLILAKSYIAFKDVWGKTRIIRIEFLDALWFKIFIYLTSFRLPDCNFQQVFNGCSTGGSSTGGGGAVRPICQKYPKNNNDRHSKNRKYSLLWGGGGVALLAPPPPPPPPRCVRPWLAVESLWNKYIF